MMTKREKTIPAKIIEGSSIGKASCMPKETKKIVAKKSLKDLTRLTTSSLYDEEARVTPARKEPIATE